jgi:hypothetical protein
VLSQRPTAIPSAGMLLSRQVDARRWPKSMAWNIHGWSRIRSVAGCFFFGPGGRRDPRAEEMMLVSTLRPFHPVNTYNRFHENSSCQPRPPNTVEHSCSERRLRGGCAVTGRTGTSANWAEPLRLSSLRDLLKHSMISPMRKPFWWAHIAVLEIIGRKPINVEAQGHRRL